MIKKICLMIGLLIIVTTPVFGENAKSNTTSISAFNSYRISVQLEVKCDWDQRVNRFTFHKFFVIPGRSNVTIIVPNSMKKCECWSKILW